MKKILMLGLAVFVLTPGAFAQDYPNRVVTLVAPFPPGGPSDTTARMIIGPMAKALGQQIIVDKLNKALGVALSDPDVVKRFADLGYDVVSADKRSADYFDKFYKDEVTLWAKVLGGLGAGAK